MVSFVGFVLQRWQAPMVEARGETIALVGPITPKAELLHIGNNRIISLLPYQGYTVTQIQVNGM